MKRYNLLWITLIILSLQHPRRAASFQCYECENCPSVGENERKYLKECGLPENLFPRPTITTTTEASAETSEEEESEEQTSAEVEETSPETTSTSTTSTSTSMPTSTDTSPSTSSSSPPTSTLADNSTAAESTTQGIQAFTTESEEANSAEDTAEVTTVQEKKKGSAWSLFPRSDAARQLPGKRPVCYILKVKYDGFEVTNRGCGAAVEDKNITCKMLSKGQPYAECQICEGDFCNSAARVKSLFLGSLLGVLVIAINLW